MGLFTPYKKRANRFNYTPRFYDPVKEAREMRRREMHGESAQTDQSEYTPGMYLHTQRDARAERRGENGRRTNRNSPLVLAAAAALVILFGYMLYPRIAQMLSLAGRRTAPATVTEEFDPYAPITVVPNDYQGE